MLGVTTRFRTGGPLRPSDSCRRRPITASMPRSRRNVGRLHASARRPRTPPTRSDRSGTSAARASSSASGIGPRPAMCFSAYSSSLRTSSTYAPSESSAAASSSVVTSGGGGGESDGTWLTAENLTGLVNFVQAKTTRSTDGGTFGASGRCGHARREPANPSAARRRASDPGAHAPGRLRRFAARPPASRATSTATTSSRPAWRHWPPRRARSIPSAACASIVTPTPASRAPCSTSCAAPTGPPAPCAPVPVRSPTSPRSSTPVLGRSPDAG